MRLQYLDWLRGVAVVAMVLAHTTDSWTLDADRRGEPWYTVAFIGGVASPLFLFLAGLATALSAASKRRRAAASGPAEAHAIGARQARRRGWQIFGLGLLFRVQSQLLGLGPLQNLFKVDMLNVMGLAMVLAASIWQVSPVRRMRVIWLALATVAVAMVTPIVRDVTWLAALPDPLEAYLRPAGPYAAFPFFPWAGFLFAGVIVGELVDAVRTPSAASASGRPAGPTAAAASVWLRLDVLQTGLVLAGGAAVLGGWWASWQPSIYPSSNFWNDSPTFFFIRLGLVTLLVPMAWILEQLIAPRVFAPLVTLGHASLFVYWIHVEMVYGVAAEPLKRSLPLGQAIAATTLLTCGLYGLVVLKNRYWPRLKRNQVGHLRHQRTVDHAAGS